MLGYSVAQYLSRFQVSTPLWGEKLIPLIDYVLSNNYANNKQLSEAYYQIVNKYVNTSDLNLSSLTNYVKEMGYDYILNFFTPDEEGTRDLVSFLAAIHFLKGSRKGLHLILSLMGIKPPSILDENGRAIPLIQDWYEPIPMGVTNTFTLNIDSNTLADNNNPQTYTSFKEFIRNYVYPEVNFVVNYDVELDYNIYSDMQGSMRLTYPIIISNSAIMYNLVDDIDWTYTGCYKDDYNRIILDSTETWNDSDTQTWSNTGGFFGVDGLWGEPCVSSATLLSSILEGTTSEQLYFFAYNVLKDDPEATVTTEVRTSSDNINWSDWKVFSKYTSTAQYLQLKVSFNSPNNKLIILTQ